MVYQQQTHAGSDVARTNKIRLDLFSLLQSAKSRTVDKKIYCLAHCQVEWQTALVSTKLSRYGIDMAASSKTRLSRYDSLKDHGYTGFQSSRTVEERREVGVEFALRKEIAAILKEVQAPVNDSIMTTRLPFRKKLNAVFISVYAPTMTNP